MLQWGVWLVAPSPGAGPPPGHGGLARRAAPLAHGDAVEHRPQAEEVEGLVALVAQDELLVVAWEGGREGGKSVRPPSCPTAPPSDLRLHSLHPDSTAQRWEVQSTSAMLLCSFYSLGLFFFFTSTSCICTQISVLSTSHVLQWKNLLVNSLLSLR